MSDLSLSEKVVEIIISMVMSFDGPPIPPPVKVGDLIWAFDVRSDMKVPMEVVKTYENGEWDGIQAWSWGWA